MVSGLWASTYALSRCFNLVRAQNEDTVDGDNVDLWDAVSLEADAEVDDEAGHVQEATVVERSREELTYTVHFAVECTTPLSCMHAARNDQNSL